jgi:hypothetical protein
MKESDMHQPHPAFSEVTRTCELIQGLFSGADNGPTACASLLAHFSNSFSMIATGGQQLDYQALAGFFRQAAGSKPGLQIDVTDIVLLHESEQLVVLSYKETQAFGDGSANLRCATALFEKTADGRLLWRHLHETMQA